MTVLETRVGEWEGSRKIQQGVNQWHTSETTPELCAGNWKGGLWYHEVTQRILVKCLICVTLPDASNVTENKRDKALASWCFWKTSGRTGSVTEKGKQRCYECWGGTQSSAGKQESIWRIKGTWREKELKGPHSLTLVNFLCSPPLPTFFIQYEVKVGSCFFSPWNPRSPLYRCPFLVIVPQVHLSKVTLHLPAQIEWYLEDLSLPGHIPLGFTAPMIHLVGFFRFYLVLPFLPKVEKVFFLIKNLDDRIVWSPGQRVPRLKN